MSPSRRRFLRHATGAVVASASPRALHALDADDARAGGGEGRAEASLDALEARLRSRDPADEAYWRVVRDQFPMRELILMNAANLCPSPYPVQRRVFELTEAVDRDASFQNRARFGPLTEEARSGLAWMMGCDPDEVAIVRNTSSANATVVNGLDLGPGDEVVLWDQNHPTNAVAWDVAAERRGFTVRRVATPPEPAGDDAVLGAFAAAMGPRTRVVAFSHLSNVSGVAVPARALVRMAHERDAFVLVDGAQTFGALEVDLHEIGCDAYSGSAHKWPVGPKEAGLLYVRRAWHDRLWPTHVGVGWESAAEGGARKFEVLGQRDDAAVAAVGEMVRFHRMIGKEVVDARVRQLATALKEALRSRVPGVRFHTPPAPERSGGVVVFALPGVEGHAPLFERLYAEHRVAGAAMGGAFDGLRLCPHVYNTLEQVEAAADAVAGLA